MFIIITKVRISSVMIIILLFTSFYVATSTVLESYSDDQDESNIAVVIGGYSSIPWNRIEFFTQDSNLVFPKVPDLPDIAFYEGCALWTKSGYLGSLSLKLSC